LYTALHGKPIAKLWSVTYRMGLCGATCHPTQVNKPGRLVLDLPILEGWKAELTLMLVLILRWFTCQETVNHPRNLLMLCTFSCIRCKVFA